MFLSVIVCTYNRDKHLGRALESLIKQDFDRNLYEIIVVDNNSADNTSKIIKNFKQKYPDFNIITALETHQGLSYARNKGIELSRGNYISFIDDDAIARQDYISKISFYTRKYPEIFAFGGKVLPRYENGKEPAWMSHYIERIISIVDRGEKVKIFKKSYPVGCNMIFKREIFEKLGGFNTRLRLRSDDKYIFEKIKKAGYEILYLPEVVVEHFIDDFRTKKEYVVRISRLNGRAENIRINTLEKGKTLEKIKRMADYVFKVFASLILWMIFAMKGQWAKGKMLFLSLWNQLMGFIFPESIKEY